MGNYSKNKKLNGVLNDIEKQLMTMCDTQSECMEKIKDYINEFRREPEFNLAQYGNLLIGYYDIREMYTNAGYTTMDNMSNDKIWKTYRRQVGYVARCLNNKWK